MTARSDIDEATLEEALAWQVALESDDADWDGYVAWLEADPCHREAFDSVVLLSAAINDHRPEIAQLLEAQIPVDVRPVRRSWRLPYLAGGLAAAVALIIAFPLYRTSEPVKQYSANGGSSRIVTLADGVSVTLSPASRIVVRGRDANRIELASGEAYFDVKHDPGRTLAVSAGDYQIADIGTRFSVNIASHALRVAVSEGTVTVASASTEQPIKVAAGQQLMGNAAAITLSPAPKDDVASWRSGRLSYTDTPLALVVGDIVRYTGKPVSLDPSLEQRHFSGTLVIGDRSKLLTDLTTVLEVDVQKQGSGFRLRAPANR